MSFITRLALCLSLILASGGISRTWTHGDSRTWTQINCTGVQATDDALFATWETTAKAANPATTPTRITGNCAITSAAIFAGINNVVFSAYGATITPFLIGPVNTISNTGNHFLNAAAIGDTSIILQNSAAASNYIVGRYMLVTGLENQYPDCGFPPNPAFFDIVNVTSVVGAQVNFAPALTNNYKTTWPLVCVDAIFTGSISGTTLNVTAMSGSNAISIGPPLGGAGISAGTVVTAFGTGTGNAGTYTINNSQTVASESMTVGGASFTGSISGTTLTVTSMAGGIAVGRPLVGAGILSGTEITALGTGSGAIGTYTINNSQTVGSETMTTGGDGPASAYPVHADWDTDIQISGLSITATSLVSIRGRSVSCTDCTLATDNVNGNISPTLAGSITLTNSTLGTAELDKIINNLTFNHVTAQGTFHWSVQSASIKQFTLVNSTQTNLQGTPLNVTISGGTYGNILAGPNGYGAAKTFSISNATVTSGQAGFARVLKSATSFSGGTISMLLTDPNIGSFIHMGVPGFKYVLADDHCPNCGSPQAAFTITDITMDATNYIWHVDVGSVPTSTCSGSPCPFYDEFAAQTVTQVNTPGFDFTQWAAPP